MKAVSTPAYLTETKEREKKHCRQDVQAGHGLSLSNGLVLKAYNP